MNDTAVKIRIWPFIAAAAVFAVSLVFLFEALFTDSLAYVLPFTGYGGTFLRSHIKIGSASVSLYRIAQAAGFAACAVMCVLRRKKYDLSPLKAVLSAVLMLIVGFAGAKALYIAENLNYVTENGLSLGGYSFFGTVFLIPLLMPLTALAFKEKPALYLDYCTPEVLLMLAFIRLGCFMNGCCEGISFWFKNRPVTLPVQLFEAALDLLLMGIILYLEDKGKLRKKLYFIFMGGYGILRFALEFIRDTPKTHLGLSNGQLFSVICIFIGIAALVRPKKESSQ